MKQQGVLKRVAAFIGLAEDRGAAEVLDEAQIRDWLIERLARYAKLDPDDVDTARDFEDYGLDSRSAVRVAGDLEKLVERRLSPALLYEQKNIDSLATWLAEQVCQPETESEPEQA